MKDKWIDTRLNKEEMDFLRNACSEENKKDHSNSLAGNIYKSELITDKDNWFYETVLKKLTERMFYRDWDAYYKYHIDKVEPPPEFKLKSLWVNYQKQYEFNPPHSHNGDFTFVVFMKIPTHSEEQHALPFSANSNMSCASDFSFLLGQEHGPIQMIPIPLSPEDEGRILFFPAWLQHQVFPFYGTEEERITISGNIRWVNPKHKEEYWQITPHPLDPKPPADTPDTDSLYKMEEEIMKMAKKGMIKWEKK